MTQREFSHIPVMKAEVMRALNVRAGGIYVDGTLGGAGHALEIAGQGGVLIGIDRDEAAIDAARSKLFGQFTLVHDNFNNITQILKTLIINKIDGALLDLGVSSYQFDTPERGFSYRFDAPLDMRMDTKSSLTAKKIVNELEAGEIEKILFKWGEEPYSRAIARAIAKRRAKAPIETTFELADIIKGAIPPKARQGKHPAKRVFQAIRIAVNDELSNLSKAIEDFCAVLCPGGRLAVITFHSLEDRIVKSAFASLAAGCTCPRDFPICVCGNAAQIKIVTKKPILPSKGELLQNRRSTSAKLRVAEKL